MSESRINSIYGGGLRNKSEAQKKQEKIVYSQMEKINKATNEAESVRRQRLNLGATTHLPSWSIPSLAAKKTNKPVGIIKKYDTQNQTKKPKTIKRNVGFGPIVKVAQTKQSLSLDDNDYHQNCIDLAIRFENDPNLKYIEEERKKLQECTKKIPTLTDNINRITIEKSAPTKKERDNIFYDMYTTKRKVSRDIYNKLYITKEPLTVEEQKTFNQALSNYRTQIKGKPVPTITGELDEDKRKDLTQFFIYESTRATILSCNILYELYNITNTTEEYRKNIATNQELTDNFCINIYTKLYTDKLTNELNTIINAIPNIEEFILQNFVQLALQSLLDKHNEYPERIYDVYCQLAFNPVSFYDTSIIIYKLFKHLNNNQDFSTEVFNQLIVKLDSVDRNSEDIQQNIPELITSATFNLAKIFLKFMLIEKRDTKAIVSLEITVGNLFIADNSPFVDLLKLCKAKSIFTILEYEYINYILPLFILVFLLKKKKIYNGSSIFKIINKITDNGGRNYYIQKYLVNNFENLYYFYIYDVNKLFKKDDDKLNNNLQSLYGTQNILKYMTNTLKLTFVDTNSDE